MSKYTDELSWECLAFLLSCLSFSFLLCFFGYRVFLRISICSISMHVHVHSACCVCVCACIVQAFLVWVSEWVNELVLLPEIREWITFIRHSILYQMNEQAHGKTEARIETKRDCGSVLFFISFYFGRCHYVCMLSVSDSFPMKIDDDEKKIVEILKWFHLVANQAPFRSIKPRLFYWIIRLFFSPRLSFGWRYFLPYGLGFFPCSVVWLLSTENKIDSAVGRHFQHMPFPF